MEILRTGITFSSGKLRWNLVAVPVVLVLVISIWISYDRHGPLPLNLSPRSPRASNVADPMPAALPKPPVKSDQPPSPAIGVTATPAVSPFKRMRIGNNEIDYVADDVTIRHFNRDVAPTPTQRWHRQVDIGEDVTVHYFTATAEAGPQLRPASAIQTSSEPTRSK